MVSLKSAGSMRAASSRMRMAPPVPFVPCGCEKRRDEVRVR
jgi:hypothetical protein